MIPPALFEVVELMRKRVLGELIHDAQQRAEEPVSQDERFAEPAEGMSDGEEVEEAAEEVVDGEVAILAVVFLLDGFAERDVEEAHELPRKVFRLEVEVDEGEEVDEVGRQHKSPDGRMGASEGTVSTLQHAEDHEHGACVPETEMSLHTLG